jgi:hypothetical protein
MSTRLQLLAAAAILMSACGPKGAESDAAATPPPNDAQRAAAIATALAAAPTKGDSILAANGLTTQQFEEMMFRIAADSTLSAEYQRLTAR